MLPRGNIRYMADRVFVVILQSKLKKRFMDIIKQVMYLRSIDGETEENNGLESADEIIGFADYFKGDLLGFCDHDNKIMAIVADYETGKLYQVRLEELFINKEQ